jgi:hypothetical protein
MDKAKVKALTSQIKGLQEGERQALAQEVLPLLLATRAGVEAIDEALQGLSDHELDALVERARRRGRDLPEEFVAAVIGEALRAGTASSRP